MYYTAILRRCFTLREADYRGRRAELLPHNCWLMYCGSSSALRAGSIRDSPSLRRALQSAAGALKYTLQSGNSARHSNPITKDS
jgi:hypothetical protein